VSHLTRNWGKLAIDCGLVGKDRIESGPSKVADRLYHQGKYQIWPMRPGGEVIIKGIILLYTDARYLWNFCDCTVVVPGYFVTIITRSSQSCQMLVWLTGVTRLTVFIHTNEYIPCKWTEMLKY